MSDSEQTPSPIGRSPRLRGPSRQHLGCTAAALPVRGWPACAAGDPDLVPAARRQATGRAVQIADSCDACGLRPAPGCRCSRCRTGADPASAPVAQALSGQGAGKKDEHRPVVVTYGGPTLPAYMKPKDPPQAAEAAHGGITYKPGRVRGQQGRHRSRIAISSLCQARSPASWTR